MKKIKPNPEEPITTAKDREETGDPRMPGTGERNYPPFESAADQDATLLPIAEKWAKASAEHAWQIADKLLKPLTKAQEARVIIMAQRVLTGREPIPKKKEKKDATS